MQCSTIWGGDLWSDYVQLFPTGNNGKCWLVTRMYFLNSVNALLPLLPRELGNVSYIMYEDSHYKIFTAEWGLRNSDWRALILLWFQCWYSGYIRQIHQAVSFDSVFESCTADSVEKKKSSSRELWGQEAPLELIKATFSISFGQSELQYVTVWPFAAITNLQ